MPAVLRTVIDHIRYTASLLHAAQLHFGHGTDNAVDDATELVLGVLSLPPDLPPLLGHGALTEDESGRVMNAIKSRVDQRVPTAYITGRAFFAGYEFVADPRALVPRSPIAELIEQGFAPWFAQPPQRLLDLGTGGGCIAIACALSYPDSEVMGSDIDPQALALATINNTRYGSPVKLLQSDLFAALSGQTFDLIVSNPPYVPQRLLEELPDEFAAEPANALFSGVDGLDHPRAILAQAAHHLTDDGYLCLEVGLSQTALTEAMPLVEFEWVDFARGGEGVAMVSRHALLSGLEMRP